MLPSSSRLILACVMPAIHSNCRSPFFDPKRTLKLERAPFGFRRKLRSGMKGVRQFRKGTLQAFMSGWKRQPAFRPIPKFTG